MKQITLILLLTILGIGVNAQEPTLGKTVLDTTIEVNYKYKQADRYIKRAIADLKRFAAQEKKQSGKIEFKKETKDFIRDANLLLKTYKPLFTTVTITPSVIDTVQIKVKIKDIKLSIKDLKSCDVCDSVQIEDQIKDLRKEVKKLKSWLDQ